MTEPFDIAAALFDPSRVADGVVSLLDVMGVAIYATDGALLREGADHGAGQLWLTEGEVRGLIAMTREDMSLMGEFGGPFPIADMYEALAPSLPAGYTIDDFTAAYDEAYASNPDSLAAQVMFGQPIDPQTGLLRVQMWLLLIDGFVGPTGEAARPPAMAAALSAPADDLGRIAQLPSGSSLGVARQNLPPLTSEFAGLSGTEWAELLARLPTLAFAFPFETFNRANAHEGHGGPGASVSRVALLSAPASLVSQQTGRMLLESVLTPNPLSLTWNSHDVGTLNAHGQLDSSLGTPVQTSGAGTATIVYTPKEEAANGNGVAVRDIASLYAEAEQFDLVAAVYDLDSALGPARWLIQGRRIADNPGFDIGWHEVDTIELTILNTYDFTMGIAFGAETLTLHGAGKDLVQGVLARWPDDTYRGVLFAQHLGSAQGKALLGLAGPAECSDIRLFANQDVYVVGRLVDWAGVYEASQYPIWSGAFGEKDLELRFYPATAPEGSSSLCQPTIPFFGGGPDGRPPGDYIPMNDTRWSDPEAGYQIHLPLEETVEYEDRTQVAPESQVCSVWHITVTQGIWPTPASPPPSPPPPPSKVCEAAEAE